MTAADPSFPLAFAEAGAGAGPSPPLRAAIMDMDGLLIDTEPVWRQAEAAVFTELGSHLSEAEMLSTMGRRVAEVVAHWRRHRPWPAAETGVPSDAAVADWIIDRMVEHVRSRGEAMPGVREAIALFGRFRLPVAIASSSPSRLIDAVCERLGLDDIQVRCSAVDEVHGKPAPDVFLRAARRLGVPPASCLAIEDSPNGVVAARAAGMRCVAIPDPHLQEDPRYGEADLVRPSLLDLDADALRSLGGRPA
jgi:HAD superfamily hydrolase (TIGR01509 family)